MEELDVGVAKGSTAGPGPKPEEATAAVFLHDLHVVGIVAGGGFHYDLVEARRHLVPL